MSYFIFGEKTACFITRASFFFSKREKERDKERDTEREGVVID